MAKWNPISTAPIGREFLACIEVTNVSSRRKWWEQHVLYRDDEDGCIGVDHHKGWDIEDYTGWRELPAPPTGKARKLCETAAGVLVLDEAQEREAFKRWAKDRGYPYYLPPKDEAPEHYSEIAWFAWQTRASRGVKEVGDAQQ